MIMNDNGGNDIIEDSHTIFDHRSDKSTLSCSDVNQWESFRHFISADERVLDVSLNSPWSADNLK